jgi:hypothetical protein
MVSVEPDAEFSEPHFDRLAVPAFAFGLGFGQRLRLVGRACRTKTVFRELVSRGRATQIRFGRVLFCLAQEQIAHRKIGVNLSGGWIRFRVGQRVLRRVLGSHGPSIERESLSHSEFQAGPVLDTRHRQSFSD